MHEMPLLRQLTLLLAGLCLTACATPRLQQAAPSGKPPELLTARVVMDDGYSLPLTLWQADTAPRAVVLALHGFNDYRNAFETTGRALAVYGIVTYAYDQRGFGETAQRGIWPGSRRLQDDARQVVALLRRKHPHVPLYLLGDSMGGAVVMGVVNSATAAPVDGVILVAPAVRGWHTLPLWQRATLWLSAHTLPAQTVTGEGLEIMASDHIDMLRTMARDPLIIKETRIDAIYGLADLMDTALLASPRFTTPALILYGERDEIIPRVPFCMLLNALPAPPDGQWRLVLYPEGYHMLTRDLQADVVLADIAAWLLDRRTPLPSEHEVTASQARGQLLCTDV
jgi:alpha-beta hydrolase superfamily lysophospholipase